MIVRHFPLKNFDVVLERKGLQNAEGLDGEKKDAKKGRRTSTFIEYPKMGVGEKIGGDITAVP